MIKDTWKTIGIRDKFQMINGTTLVISSIVLYFVAFIVTLTIHFEVVSAGATLLGAGLAFFGINAFIRNEMMHFEAKVGDRLRKMEEDERRRNSPMPERNVELLNEEEDAEA